MTQMKLLSTAEVAELTGFTPRTIARWCRQHEWFKAPKKVGRVWRIRSDDPGLRNLRGFMTILNRSED